MTMTTMPESLNSPVSGKAVFMEFGPPGQQMPPSPMSHGHYSMHCLHSAGHSQPPDAASYSPASSFSRPLGYPYVGGHSANPYMSSVQSYPNSTSLAQSRLEETGTCPGAGRGARGRGGEQGSAGGGRGGGGLLESPRPQTPKATRDYIPPFQKEKQPPQPSPLPLPTTSPPPKK